MLKPSRKWEIVEEIRFETASHWLKRRISIDGVLPTQGEQNGTTWSDVTSENDVKPHKKHVVETYASANMRIRLRVTEILR